MMYKSLNLSEFHYELPSEKIAKHPLNNRSDSKLLSFKGGKIDHKSFRALPEVLESGCHLVFNDTKVIPARLIFHKDTGARIEIFLLEPSSPSHLHMEVMAAKKTVTWHCMVGNSKKWKEGTALEISIGDSLHVRALRLEDNYVKFEWDSDETFSEIVTAIGNIPLPPYLNREVEEDDKPRYQTVYSNYEGAVAAPTAGLHFTEEILEQLESKNISTDYLTLHVSAGTFQPIKAKSVDEHPMHREQIIITKSNIENLLKKDVVIPVGTTSMRTMESLYWFGAKLFSQPDADFFIEKMTPYQETITISKEQSLKNILLYMDQRNLEILVGHTEIFIFPGYQFRICKGLITNFHLPASTLILLVAALIGDKWKEVYQSALDNDYRFLSYGDSSLLIP
ncbi:MAG: S-adenosylmethionine:tRNA ribosyltransferase-isomerase [Cyclobacteriaceae bacterium]